MHVNKYKSIDTKENLSLFEKSQLIHQHGSTTLTKRPDFPGRMMTANLKFETQ